MLLKTLDEIEAWNRGGNYSGRPGETQRDIQALVDEVRKLRAALASVPVIAEEIRQKWDEGMRAGKLPIALIDPKLQYRADITAIHEAIAEPAEPAPAEQ